MDELQVVIGIRGAENIFYEGYKYGKRRNRGSTFITWRCAHYKKFTCFGTMKTSLHPYSGPAILKEHNHPPDAAELEVEEMRKEMRQQAFKSRSARPVDLVTSALQNASEEAKMSSACVDTMKRDLRRMRQRRLPKTRKKVGKRQTPEGEPSHDPQNPKASSSSKKK